MAEIDDLLREDRTFPPPADFKARALVRDDAIYAEAERDPEAFWARFADELEWSRRWDRVLDWQPPHAKWFVGGTLNASVNCLDRHVRGARRNKAALIWEGEPGDRRTLTYFDLYRQVSAFANVLKSLGIKRGDRVAIYLPLIPELAIAMLACARIGAVHSVVFGGFSAESLRDRINDQKARLLITADGGYRRGQVVPLKQVADEALTDAPSIEHVIVVQRGAAPMPVHVQHGRDLWYHSLMQDAPLTCDPEPMDAEDMLYILYTSGTTGKPKGIVHTTGGYMVGTYATTKLVFDLHEEDVYWCTADIGWVTGHSYVVYGPLANGATVVMYEGAPDWPQKDRFWSLIEVGGGLLALTRPWPSMLRGIYGDPERYVRQYWNKWGPAVYVTGDGAKRDADGCFWLLGRVDDVINVAGHRIGTMEVESALVDHPSVAEAAVVGRAHDIKGQAIAAFVTVKEGMTTDKDLADKLKEHVVKKIGSIARPDDILFTADLPKTRSGKIMRRLLRDIAEGKALGDTTTLADPGAVAKLKANYEEEYG